jgi:hypothetical protein
MFCHSTTFLALGFWDRVLLCGLKLQIVLPLLSKCWDYKYAPLCLVWIDFFFFLAVLELEALYCFSYTSSPFSSGYFGDKVLLLPRPAWTKILLFYASHWSWDDRCAPLGLNFFLLRWGCHELYPPPHSPSLPCPLGLELWSSWSRPPLVTWYGKHAALCTSYWLRWGLANFFAWAGPEPQYSRSSLS